MALPLLVTFTMDCERISAESPPGGPATWALSERSIRGYCERLIEAGYPPTLFIVPECAARHAELFGRLAERGADLGLHVHPQSFRDHRYTRYLGEYDRGMQRAILSEALEDFTRAVGVTPTSFRPGNFSISAETYRLLVELGFRQGSVSDPGRNAPRFAAVWEGAYPFPHWASDTDALEPGALPFFEVPVTTDPSRREKSGFPREMRIEFGAFGAWHLPILNRALERMAQADAPFRAVCVFTHNFVNYGDPNDPNGRTLRDMLRHFQTLEADCGVVPATLPTARRNFVALVGKP